MDIEWAGVADCASPTRRPAIQEMRGVFSEKQLRSIPGHTLLRSVAEGALAHPPIYRTVGLRLIEVGEGKVVVEATPARRFYNPIGSIHGGYISILLDSCMGCAVHSRLPKAVTYTTIEIKINYVRSLKHESGSVRGYGSVIHLGRRIATAEGRLVDASGRLYAHGVSTCSIFPVE